jgi:hypothetical protein
VLSGEALLIVEEPDSGSRHRTSCTARRRRHPFVDTGDAPALGRVGIERPVRVGMQPDLFAGIAVRDYEEALA